jgi:hypothetical protein
MDKLTLYAFQANKEPQLCSEFLREHIKVLEDFGIANVTDSNGPWQDDPQCFVIVAMHDQLGMVGGIRLQMDHPGTVLPMEKAVGKLDPKVGVLLRDLARHGNGEVCSLWNANRYGGKGIPVLLSQAVTAFSYPVGVRRMVCLVAPYTKRHPSTNGFIVDQGIGDKGEFAYPRPDFKGIVMVNPDTLLLTHAHPLQRQVLYSLRLRPEQTRVEQPGREAIQVHYKMQMQADPKELIAYQQINEEHLRHCA